MGKGSSPAGNTTTTTINPTAQAQLPYLQDVWGKAQNLYNQNPTNLAAAPAILPQGYNDLYNTGQSIDQTLRPTTNAAFNTALTGGYGVQNSPAYSALSSLAAGTTAPQTAATGYGAQAAAGTGVGYDQLAASARGDYLNKNPYIDRTVQAALDPVARTYQTVTDPTTRGNFATAGRYGSPALEGAGGVRSTNELNLAKSLGDISAGIYSKDYQSERALQDAAARDYVTGRNAGLGLGIDASKVALGGQEYGAGQLQTGYQAGNTAAMQALQEAPAIYKTQFTAPQSAIDAGLGLRGLSQQELDAPYTTLGKYSSLAGQPVGGSSSLTSPYFQNSTANTLSALTGAAGLANTLGGSGTLGLGTGGGLSGLFGSGAGAAAADFGGGGAALGIADSLAPAALSAAELAPAAALTIICTELMKQGRMPRRWWRASVRDWMPEIVHRGYLVWARPSVRHLRKHPYSLYSRLLCTAFNWRGEDAAARHGFDKQARRLWRGRAVTAALAIPCLVLGVAAAIGVRLTGVSDNTLKGKCRAAPGAFGSGRPA